MKLSEVKPTPDVLFTDIEGVLLNPNKGLSLQEVKLVLDNEERLTTEQYVRFVNLYRDEYHTLCVEADQSSVASTGRTVIEQINHEVHEGYLAEQRKNSGKSTE